MMEKSGGKWVYRLGGLSWTGRTQKEAREKMEAELDRALADPIGWYPRFVWVPEELRRGDDHLLLGVVIWCDLGGWHYALMDDGRRDVCIQTPVENWGRSGMREVERKARWHLASVVWHPDMEPDDERVLGLLMKGDEEGRKELIRLNRMCKRIWELEQEGLDSEEARRQAFEEIG